MTEDVAALAELEFVGAPVLEVGAGVPLDSYPVVIANRSAGQFGDLYVNGRHVGTVLDDPQVEAEPIYGEGSAPIDHVNHRTRLLVRVRWPADPRGPRIPPAAIALAAGAIGLAVGVYTTIGILLGF